jgi:hypothetical protein
MGGSYHHTEFSVFLQDAADAYLQARTAGRIAVPFHVVLDEMNLARVEYYFAKFLSGMESRSRGRDTEIELAPTRRILLPPNLCFIGTVNIDETTHGFADKVYDRAQLIELTATRDDLMRHIGDVPFKDVLLAIWDAIKDVAPFAYRVISEIKTYVSEAKQLGVPWEQALDDQLLQKVLPKVKGIDPRLNSALIRFKELTETRFPLSHEKANRMLAGLAHGFTSYF